MASTVSPLARATELPRAPRSPRRGRSSVPRLERRRSSGAGLAPAPAPIDIPGRSPSSSSRSSSRSSRGRDASPKSLPNLNDTARSPHGLSNLPAVAGRRISATSLAAPLFQAHHQPPPAAAVPEPHADPILYLPPLLSRLPHEAVPDPSDEFETRLPDIDPASLALHQALHYLRPLGAGYARRAYPLAFNWHELALPAAAEREWYAVVFRSRRRPESESISLYAADRAAHAEAVRNGGLVMYWYGVPDASGRNLATCIWQSRRHAVNAVAGPKHVLAMRQAAGAYETYDLERWVIRKSRGRKHLELEKWTGGDVGW